MGRLFPLPFLSFLKIIAENGGISRSGIAHSLPWLVKTTILEPLRWIEVLTKSKAVRKHQLPHPPIFILGYYRSGTTYLQELFMQDRRYGYTSTFMVVFPEIALTGEPMLRPALEFFSKAFRLENPFHRVPLNWEMPGEEDVAITASLNPAGSQWGFFFPGHCEKHFHKHVLLEDLTDAEMRDWEGSYQWLLKKISLANQGRRLVLKNPPNTARIKHLLAMFPDAKFVFIHRDPYDVYASNRRLWNVIRRHYSLGSFRNIDINSLIIDHYKRTMDRYLDQRNIIPAGNLAEVAYEQLLHHPVETMRYIYDSLDLDEFRVCESAIAAFAGTQQSYNVLTHELSEPERARLTKEFDRFIRVWNYQMRS